MSVKQNTENSIAVLDIGSNAVRLVIYDHADRAPVKLYNERSICSLGRGMADTGHLDKDGVQKALKAISRFARLIEGRGIKNVRAVATAALRDAKDGTDFIKRVKKNCGINIEIIDGDEEARLSALGVMMNGVSDTGVIGDFGGGSLELIAIARGKIIDKVSLPLGTHRILGLATREARVKYTDQNLDAVSFIKKYKSADFYALGGAWRSLAKAHIHAVSHPLKIIDHYTMIGKKAEDFARLIAHQSKTSLSKIEGFSQKRIDDVGAGALVLHRLLQKMQPSRVVFSGTGLREVLIFDSLSPKVKREDPLISSCRKLSGGIDVKSATGLARWLLPLFPAADAAFFRALESVSLLSDVSAQDHEDYQARHAFDRILTMPIYGADHALRLYLAASVHVRYAAKQPADTVEEQVVMTTGLGLALAYILTAGAFDMLKYTELKMTPKNLTLVVKKGTEDIVTDKVSDALSTLAESVSKKAVIAFI